MNPWASTVPPRPGCATLAALSDLVAARGPLPTRHLHVVRGERPMRRARRRSLLAYHRRTGSRAAA